MKKELKAFNGFIFGGSASIGVMNAGYQLDQVLEMTDDMHEQNAYHFVQNMPQIPVVPPAQWEIKGYLDSLKNNDYDLSMFNCPCSSLSQINRNASVSLEGTHNKQFHRVYDIISKSKPKTFIIENAPTLVKLGYPLILDMISKLSDDYKFTIIRDFAGNHGVPMKRMRTLVVGWRKDYFDNKIPLIHMNKQPQKTIKDAIGDLYDAPLGSIPNHELVEHRKWKDYEHLFHLVDCETSSKKYASILLTIIENYEEVKDEIGTSNINTISNAKAKLEQGKNIWDKSPVRNTDNQPAPSLTSLTELIHPVHNRQWTVREYARLMGYPDDFVFYPEGSKTEIIQSIAQGVPAQFIEYIASEIREVLEGNRKMIDNSENNILSFQHHTKEKFKLFNQDELNEMVCLEVDKDFEDLTE